VVCPVCREPVAAADRVCEVCGAQLPEPRDRVPDHVEIDLVGLAGISDRGHVHVRNEDAMALGRLPEDGRAHTLAAVVCDGVSSVRRPELASAAATTVGLEALLAGTASGVPRMLAAIAAAADAVAQLAPDTPDAPSCTLVAALIDEQDERPVVTLGWVGDSRAYWLAGDGAAELLTTDHSWAAEMVGAGILDAATAMRDPRAHAITRWLGADQAPVPGITTLVPDGPGVVLLCSDGLWNYEPDARSLAALALPVLAREGPRAAAEALTVFALDAGGRDNITVVCIPVDPGVAVRPPTDA
jgi:serine/threonine protein phosphatase PrpC